MLNKRMEEKLEEGKAIDISACKLADDGSYILPQFVEDVDYCDKKKEAWIWSIGENAKTGEIRASTDCRFYQNSDYKCLFLR